jgi:hypothetical protein
VNFLFPFADQPRALAHVLRRAFPCVREMLPMESGQYVAFEWIGRDNYLGEIVRGNGKRTRGANVTSADAAVMFLRTDGKRQIVLIEWKYTESYGGNCLTIAKSGTDRTKIYRHLFQRDDCPVDKSLLPDFDALFYEPFYQFFRQQCLAREMERAREMDADIVSVLHLAPGPNTGFRRVTSPGLQSLERRRRKSGRDSPAVRADSSAGRSRRFSAGCPKSGFRRWVRGWSTSKLGILGIAEFPRVLSCHQNSLPRDTKAEERLRHKLSVESIEHPERYPLISKVRRAP